MDVPTTQTVENAYLVDDASKVYLGQWHRLVSTTNWEKGRIILEWRQALMAANAPASAYSDDAWSRQVGNVSSTHVGRLRRVYERFGDSRNEYDGLYWSHFQAALDWNDAEMWLEGAVQNRWSISQMRFQRWEVLGAVASERPKEDEVISGELDEDYTPAEDETPTSVVAGQTQALRDVPGGPDYSQGPDFGDEGLDRGEYGEAVPFDVQAQSDPAADSPRTEPVRPFANLPELPDDVHDAFEAFKLAIVRHKLASWSAVSCADVLAALDALKALALAPDESAT